MYENTNHSKHIHLSHDMKLGAYGKINDELY